MAHLTKIGNMGFTFIELECLNIQLTTKYRGLLLREKNRAEDRDLVLGQQLKSEDSDSNQRKVQCEVGKKQEEESEVIIKED